MNILVVDDDEDVRDMVSRYLVGRGHTVETAGGGVGLPSRVSNWWRGEKAPDAIVLDIMMPAVGGERALQLLARNKHSRDIPVVLYSAADPEEGLRLAARRRRCEFVPKTDRLSSLHDALERLTAPPANKR